MLPHRSQYLLRVLTVGLLVALWLSIALSLTIDLLPLRLCSIILGLLSIALLAIPLLPLTIALLGLVVSLLAIPLLPISLLLLTIASLLRLPIGLRLAIALLCLITAGMSRFLGHSYVQIHWSVIKASHT